MPFNFDFATTGAAIPGFGSTVTVTNTADGVKFTISGDVGGGSENVNFGNTQFTAPVILADVGADDQFILSFESQANTANTRINGDSTTPISLNWAAVVGSWRVGFRTSLGGITSPAGAQFIITSAEDSGNLTFEGTNITGVVFTSTDGAGFANLQVVSLSGAEFNCFCSGTRIATPEGEVSVEALTPGDRVLTADGKISTVKWLGRQEVDVHMNNPREINPICITAGALGDNIPARGLWVSRDHAIGIDGYLLNAGALVNGSTIYQVAQMPLEGFTYYHVETDAHELLLAEGCPAESFADYTALNTFDNVDERDGRVVSEMPLPRISAPRMLPDVIRQKVLSRKQRDAA